MFLRQTLPKYNPLREIIGNIEVSPGLLQVQYNDGSARLIPLVQHIYEQEIKRELMPHEYVAQVDGNGQNFLVENLRLYVRHPDWPEVVDKDMIAFRSEIRRAHSYMSKKDGRVYTKLFDSKLNRTAKSFARHTMEEALGRDLLPSEEVDHIDNDKTNDSIENLQVLSRKKNTEKAALERGYRVGEDMYYHCSCTQCGTPLKRLKHKTKDPSMVFCSGKCAGTYQRAREYPEGAPKVTVCCSTCGNSYTRKRATHERQKKLGSTEFFCSRSCFNAAISRLNSNPNTIGKYKCDNCGNEFERTVASVNKGKRLGYKYLCCSLRCSAIYRHKLKKAT